MSAVRTVLVSGAGSAGTAVSILLAEAGVTVDLVEISPHVMAIGSGITLQGNALRVLRRLGVWERLEKEGFGFTSTGIRAPDAAGTVVAEIPNAFTGGPDLPATYGVYRPILAETLIQRATSLGVNVRLSTSVTALDQTEDDVLVTFADGTSGRYDLVVGADGIRSRTRDLLGIELDTRAFGMGIWRAFTPRPASVTRSELYYGGPSYIAGCTPTGEDSLYAIIVEPAQDRHHLTPQEQLDVMRELSLPYHGPWDDIREVLTDPSRVYYTIWETHLLDRPWNRGRVVLIGDAVHVCPPTIAQGAAMAFEDAAVLAELLVDRDLVDDDLWNAFMERRFERAKLVVECSNQLAQWQFDHVQGDIPSLMGKVMAAVTPPA